jgi:aryl-alcohol dehydrogenase (NADP+)
VIATKLGMSEEMPGLSAANIQRASAASLERLGIDTIDLYYAHQDDESVELAETLEAFTALQDAGKIRHAAASNYSAARLEAAMRLARERDLPGFVALQPHYNLVERDEYEGALANVAERYNLACLPYFGLARGFLTGKYRGGATGGEESPRAESVRKDYFNDRGFAALAALDDVAAARDLPVATIALAWLRSQPTVLAPIASATSVEQLNALIASATLELSGSEIARLNAATG